MLGRLSARSAPEQLTIDVREEGDDVVVAVHGEVDLLTAPSLEAALAQADGRVASRVVLDLADLRFIDSTGIHVLVAAHNQATSSGRRLVLANVPARARRVLDLTGVAARFDVAQTG